MSQNKISVLYVDDNEHNLFSFRASFRRTFDVCIAQTAAEGLEILGKKEIHVILADYKMPGTTGVDFFEILVKEYPNPIRIMLTGYADINAVIAAVNKGEIYRFITKPWNEHELEMAIRQAYETYYTRQLVKTQNEELQKSYAELDKFVYSASHDLRAPLMSVLGIINMARSEKDEIDLYLNLIETSVHKLDVFIKNIIDYQRNAKSIEKIKEINFQDILTEVVEGFRFYYDSDNIDYRIKVTQNEIFLADELRLKIILNNLISNAIKYQRQDNEQQYINVGVEVTGGKAIISVEDNGIGIEKEHVSNIFKMFYRATLKNTGAGIGLYIVKEALQKLGGQIDVESYPGIGTKFLITIPSKAEHPVEQEGVLAE